MSLLFDPFSPFCYILFLIHLFIFSHHAIYLALFLTLLPYILPLAVSLLFLPSSLSHSPSPLPCFLLTFNSPAILSSPLSPLISSSYFHIPLINPSPSIPLHSLTHLSSPLQVSRQRYSHPSLQGASRRHRHWQRMSQYTGTTERLPQASVHVHAR